MQKSFQGPVYRANRRGFVLLLGVALAAVARPGLALAFDPLNGDYSRGDPLDIRLVSYNHHQNFISNPSADAEFARILTALDPDIICFQEFPSSISAGQIAARLNSVLPIGGAGWQIHLGLVGGTRTVIASRFPLQFTAIDTIPQSSTRGVTLALADLPDADYPTDLYLLGVHLKCCGDPGGTEDANRQKSADAMANWMGDARGVPRRSGNNIVLPADTPMIALGDFNLVGGPQPEDTLITGDIQDQTTYGLDVEGDWDVSDLTNLHPVDPFTGDDFTWQGSASFDPSPLDRMFFTDSVTAVAASFILNTDTMTPAALAAAGLLAGDTLPQNTSDHLPIAMDLRLVDACVVDSDGDGTADCNDGCPADPNKISPGVCGCGISDADSDGDGTADCNDGCPADPNKTAPGVCGCGIGDADSDGDGTADCNDGCPLDPEKTEPGVCGCGVADECQACGLGACADLNGDGVRDDACTWWSCGGAGCSGTATVFADLGGEFGACPPDGIADGHDRFHALNCFSNMDTLGQAGYPCEPGAPAAYNVDAGGPFGDCNPDGVCDGHDAFHALNAFDGSSACSCSGAGPGPLLPPATKPDAEGTPRQRLLPAARHRPSRLK